ncbi:MAG: transglutaminase family protein [Devosia sp.]
MKLSVHHTLTFSLGTPARAVQHVMLTALDSPQQKVERWSIDMPGIADAAILRDAFGNQAHLVSQVKPELEMVVTVTGIVETTDKSGVLGRLESDRRPGLFRRPTDATKADPSLIEGLKDGTDRIALFHELMGRVHERLSASAPMQAQGTQSQAQGKAAVAVDFAHGFIGAARGLGLPARYVTGYLLEKNVSSFHAWAEAWDDGLGWIGFDAMYDVCPADSYIRIATGLDAIGTMPIRSAPAWAEMPVEVVAISAAE